MEISEPHRDIIKLGFQDSIKRDNEAEKVRRATHLAEMNAVADLLSEHGPLDEVDGMAAFLFGMYGIHHHSREEDKQPEQVGIEERVSRFGLHNIEQPFSLSTEPNNPPWRVYAYSNESFNAHMRRAPIDSDFSAVEYEIDRSHDIYIGRIAVPVVAVDYRNMTPSNQDRATVFEISRNERTETPEQPSTDIQPQFGTLIAEWKRRGYHTSFYVEELQRVLEASLRVSR